MNYIILTTALLAGIAEDLKAAIDTSDHQQLSIEIQALNAEKVAAENNFANTTEQLNTLETELASTKQELEDVLELNTKHEEAIEKLSSGIQVVAKTTTEAPTFKNGDVTYGFKLSAIIHGGVRITPVEVCADVTLQNALIKIKSGMIYVSC